MGFDLDIKGFFDSIDHALLMRAIKAHASEHWVVLFLQRWLSAPVEWPDGTLQPRSRGTPQGAVISPLLASPFLYYALGGRAGVIRWTHFSAMPVI